MFLRRLQGLTKPGGALVVVDKVQMPPGYVGTAFSRVTLQEKLAVGTVPDDSFAVAQTRPDANVLAAPALPAELTNIPLTLEQAFEKAVKMTPPASTG